MYRKSAVQCEQLFSSTGNIVNKKRSSLEANTVNMLVNMRNAYTLLFVVILVRKGVCYLLLLTEFWSIYVRTEISLI